MHFFVVSAASVFVSNHILGTQLSGFCVCVCAKRKLFTIFSQLFDINLFAPSFTCMRLSVHYAIIAWPLVARGLLKLQYL